MNPSTDSPARHTPRAASISPLDREILPKCSPPVTSLRPVDMVVTETAAITFGDGGATLPETGPGVSLAAVLAATAAALVDAEQIAEMPL